MESPPKIACNPSNTEPLGIWIVNNQKTISQILTSFWKIGFNDPCDAHIDHHINWAVIDG